MLLPFLGLDLDLLRQAGNVGFQVLVEDIDGLGSGTALLLDVVLDRRELFFHDLGHSEVAFPPLLDFFVDHIIQLLLQVVYFLLL